MKPSNWLVISYNLPAEPSRHRVAAWRALKRMGAINIQQSMWVMPRSAENSAAMQKLAQDISAAGGESVLMESVFFRKADEDQIISLYNALRDEEYGEFVSECEKYLKEIEKEIAKEKFIYAEFEEEEAEMEKLSSWHARIAARDIHDAAGAKVAGEMMAKIEDALNGYQEMVYRHDADAGKTSGGKK